MGDGVAHAIFDIAPDGRVSVFLGPEAGIQKPESLVFDGQGNLYIAADGVAVYRIFGSLFFGAVGKLEILLDPSGELPDVVVLDLHYMISLDSTGLDTLEALHRVLGHGEDSRVDRIIDFNWQSRGTHGGER